MNHSRCDTSSTLTKQEIQNILDILPNGIVAIDFETTGLSPVIDKVIEIAAVKINTKGELSYYHAMVNPLITIPEHTIQYHQITNDMIKDELSIKKPMQGLLQFIGNMPIVAHNAQFDIGHIVKAHHEYNTPLGLSDVYDSCRFARTLYKKEEKENKPENFKLSTLASFFDLYLQHHFAMNDAIGCLRIFAHCLQKLRLNQRQEHFKNLAFLFKLNSFGNPSQYILPPKFNDLKDWVARQTPLIITYKGGTITNTPRPIRPIALLPMPTGLMLYAECMLEKINKHFHINRIKKIEILPEGYEFNQ